MHEAQLPRNLFWRNISDGEGRGFQGESTSGSTLRHFPIARSLDRAPPRYFASTMNISAVRGAEAVHSHAERSIRRVAPGVGVPYLRVTDVSAAASKVLSP